MSLQLHICGLLSLLLSAWAQAAANSYVIGSEMYPEVLASGCQCSSTAPQCCGWRHQNQYDDLVVPTSTRLVFTYMSIHNVFQFPDKQAYDYCIFSNATLVGDSRNHDDGEVSELMMDTPGDFFFGCEVAGHCSDMNQKIAVRVSDSAVVVDVVDDGEPGPTLEDPIYLPGEERGFFDLRFSAIEYHVPQVETTYVDIHWNVPQELRDQELHIVGFELIGEPNYEVLHHFVLYSCHESLHSGVREGVPYDEPRMQCKDEVLFGWAPGITKQGLPNKVGGFPMGASFTNNVHYDNPRRAAGLTDSSGLRIHYTSTLRRYDLGTLENECVGGVSPIPPHEPHYFSSHVCQLDTDSEITVVGTLQHAHLLGRGIMTEIYDVDYTTGTSTQVDSSTFRDDGWRFANHKLDFVAPTKIRPGQSLVQSCLYDSRDRSEWTNGGLGTRDEMCCNFMMYYVESNPRGPRHTHCQPMAAASGPLVGVDGLPSTILQVAPVEQWQTGEGGEEDLGDEIEEMCEEWGAEVLADLMGMDEVRIEAMCWASQHCPTLWEEEGPMCLYEKRGCLKEISELMSDQDMSESCSEPNNNRGTEFPPSDCFVACDPCVETYLRASTFCEHIDTDASQQQHQQDDDDEDEDEASADEFVWSAGLVVGVTVPSVLGGLLILLALAICAMRAKSRSLVTSPTPPASSPPNANKHLVVQGTFMQPSQPSVELTAWLTQVGITNTEHVQLLAVHFHNWGVATVADLQLLEAPEVHAELKGVLPVVPLKKVTNGIAELSQKAKK